MKKLRQYIILLALTLLAACTNTDEPGAELGGKPVPVSIRSVGIQSVTAGTRSEGLAAGELKTEFVKGDVIHLIYQEEMGTINQYAAYEYDGTSWKFLSGDNICVPADETVGLIAVCDGTTTVYSNVTDALTNLASKMGNSVDASSLKTTKDLLYCSVSEDLMHPDRGYITIEPDGGLRLTFIHYCIQLNVDITLSGYPDRVTVKTVSAIIGDENSDTDHPFPDAVNNVYSGLLSPIYFGYSIKAFKVTLNNGTGDTEVTIPLKTAQQPNTGNSYTYHLHIVPGKGYVTTNGNLTWGDGGDLTALPAGYEAITCADDLEKIRKSPGGNFILTNDIDLGGQTLASIPKLEGILNGMGHTIKNFRLEAENSGNTVFIYNITAEGVLFNLNFADVTVANTANASVAVGTLEGYMQYCGMRNVTLEQGNNSGVALIDYVTNTGVAVHCYDDHTNSGSQNMHLVNVFYGTLIGCYSTGTLVVSNYTSGNDPIVACYDKDTAYGTDRNKYLLYHYVEHADGSIDKVNEGWSWYSGSMWLSFTSPYKLKWDYLGVFSAQP